MSLLKSIRQQLGLSVTPANNFTLDASADNGTMKLVRGNAGAGTQDVMTVDAAGKVAFPQNTVVSALTMGTVKATTSGTNHDFTSIPSGTKRITVSFNAVTNSGALRIQIGTGGAPTTSGYDGGHLGGTATVANAANSAGFDSYSASGSGTFILSLIDPATNTWSGFGLLPTGNYTNVIAGSVSLSGVLDMVRITSTTGGTFSAGKVNIMYEG